MSLDAEKHKHPAPPLTRIEIPPIGPTRVLGEDEPIPSNPFLKHGECLRTGTQPTETPLVNPGNRSQALNAYRLLNAQINSDVRAGIDPPRYLVEYVNNLGEAVVPKAR